MMNFHALFDILTTIVLERWGCEDLEFISSGGELDGEGQPLVYDITIEGEPVDLRIVFRESDPERFDVHQRRPQATTVDGERLLVWEHVIHCEDPAVSTVVEAALAPFA